MCPNGRSSRKIHVKLKKDYFTKNLSPPTFLKQFTSNFQEMFLAIFRNICRKQFKKN